MKQLAYVDDGYCEASEIDGKHVVYRPLLWHERQEFYRFAKSEKAIVAMLNSRVVYGGPVAFGEAFERIVRPGTKQHLEDESNLRTGVRIALLYPHVNKPCGYCREWWFNPETGETAMQDGKPLKRPACDTLLCEQASVGCVVGHWKAPRTLSEKNKQAWRHYLECRAVGGWPDDPIVRRNAFVIGGVIQSVKRELDGRQQLVARGHRVADS